MKEFESSFFRLVDQHVRDSYSCRLVEFFTPLTDPTTYLLCFIPATAQAEIPGSCKGCGGKYVRLSAGNVESDGNAGHLSADVVRLLRQELAPGRTESANK